MPDLVILHTNDLHNSLGEQAAATLKEHKQRSDALLLDSGDAVWAGNIYFRPGGEPVLDLMSETGYDAMALGNREFHFTKMGLQSKLSHASYTVLCANVRSTRDDPLPVRKYALFERSGVTVGIFGLTVCMVKPDTSSARFSAFVFDDPLSTALDIVHQIRDQCHLLIALTHIGLRTDKALAQQVAGIDLIVGGHSHHQLDEPVVVNAVPIVQAGSHGRFYGEVKLTRHGAKWDISAGLHTLKEGSRNA